MNQSSFINYVSTIFQRPHCRTNMFFAETCKKTQPSEVNAQNGDSFVSYKRNRVQQSSIAAKAHDAIKTVVEINRRLKGIVSCCLAQSRIHLLYKIMMNHCRNFFSAKFCHKSLQIACLKCFTTAAVNSNFHEKIKLC